MNSINLALVVNGVVDNIIVIEDTAVDQYPIDSIIITDDNPIHIGQVVGNTTPTVESSMDTLISEITSSLS